MLNRSTQLLVKVVTHTQRRALCHSTRLRNTHDQMVKGLNMKLTIFGAV